MRSQNLKCSNHLFFGCAVAVELWHYFSGHSCQLGSSLLLTNTSSRNLIVASKVIWMLIARALVWVIWQERNTRKFEELYYPIEKLIIKVNEKAWNWALGETVVRNVKLEDITVNWDGVLFWQ